MIVRDLNPSDVQDGYALDRVLAGNSRGCVRLDTDYVIVADACVPIRAPITIVPVPSIDDTGRQFLGTLIGRPVLYVHEFRISPTLGAGSRSVAEGLLSFAMSKASMMGERDAIFFVDPGNEAMIKFVEDGRGMVRHSDGLIYSSMIPRRFYPRVPGGGGNGPK